MGANNGTGQPYWFRCSKCRMRGDRNDGWSGDVTLTGKIRPHRGKAGARNAHIDREYVCNSCGHKGWSCHIDLAHKAGDHPDLLMENGETYLPSWARAKEKALTRAVGADCEHPDSQIESNALRTKGGCG